MGDQQVFYAPAGTVISVRDSEGSKELIKFGKDGRLETDNPLWLNVLAPAAAAENHPVMRKRADVQDPWVMGMTQEELDELLAGGPAPSPAPEGAAEAATEPENAGKGA